MNTYIAAIGTYYLGEVEAKTLTEAVKMLKHKISQNIIGFSIYVNGKYMFEYDKLNGIRPI